MRIGAYRIRLRAPFPLGQFICKACLHMHRQKIPVCHVHKCTIQQAPLLISKQLAFQKKVSAASPVYTYAHPTVHMQLVQYYTCTRYRLRLYVHACWLSLNCIYAGLLLLSHTSCGVVNIHMQESCLHMHTQLCLHMHKQPCLYMHSVHMQTRKRPFT